jgi:hypothetical protein
MTIQTILTAASPLELGQFALSFACGMLTAPDTLSRSLYRTIVEAVEAERESRGLAAIDWPAQAKQELAYRFPAPAPAKPDKRTAKRANVVLDGADPATIESCASVLGQIAGHLRKSEPGQSAVFGVLAKALISQIPQQPSRVDPSAN